MSVEGDRNKTESQSALDIAVMRWRDEATRTTDVRVSLQSQISDYSKSPMVQKFVTNGLSVDPLLGIRIRFIIVYTPYNVRSRTSPF